MTMTVRSLLNKITPIRADFYERRVWEPNCSLRCALTPCGFSTSTTENSRFPTPSPFESTSLLKFSILLAEGVGFEPTDDF